MATVRPITQTQLASDMERQALASVVRSRAGEALAALHAAAEERKVLAHAEFEQTERDTLADVDELAAALHGFAAWAISTQSHPAPATIHSRLKAAAFSIANLITRIGK